MVNSLRVQTKVEQENLMSRRVVWEWRGEVTPRRVFIQTLFTPGTHLSNLKNGRSIRSISPGILIGPKESCELVDNSGEIDLNGLPIHNHLSRWSSTLRGRIFSFGGCQRSVRILILINYKNNN